MKGRTTLTARCIVFPPYAPASSTWMAFSSTPKIFTPSVPTMSSQNTVDRLFHGRSKRSSWVFVVPRPATFFITGLSCLSLVSNSLESNPSNSRYIFLNAGRCLAPRSLLLGLKNIRTTTNNNIEIALASNSEKYNYDRKVSRPETKKLLGLFDEDRLILRNDPRVQHGRGKPAPDIYLLALKTINSSLHGSDTEITPKKCLVFEDSIPGVETGRRAGMRVAWVPHPELAAEYKGRKKEILAGRIGLVEIGDEWQLGEIDDGWAEQLPSLDMFPFEKFGIEISKGVPLSYDNVQGHRVIDSCP
jgi:hypothetical protein